VSHILKSDIGLSQIIKDVRKEEIEKFLAQLRIIQVIDFERMDQWKTIQHQFIEGWEEELKKYEKI